MEKNLRRPGPILLTVLIFFFFGFAIWRSSAESSAAAQSAQLVRTSKTPTPASPQAPDGAVLAPVVAPPGSQLYMANRGDSITSVARRYLSQTSYLTSGELSEAIRKSNGEPRSVFLKAGQPVIIPGILDAPIVEKAIPVARDFEVRAVYLTGVMAASDRGLRIIRRWRELGGNAVVFDIKDSDGSINIAFDHPLAGPHRAPIHDLPKFTRFLHSQGMHAIARVAIFRDERLVVTHPELAVKSKRSGQAWRENGKLVWTDPSQPKVQDYDIALAKKAAESGADEIQFDYVRFPAEGDQKDASFAFQTQHPAWHRTDVITDFLRRAYAELHPTGVLLSLDVFGIMAWQRPVDLAHTGQDIVGMAKYCDVLSPMIYPSHFFGMDGIARPGDAPEHFIGESMERFEKITQGSGVVIRPWLQAFRWRTKTYSPKYIEVQVLTAKNKGGIGFLFWNASNDYSKPYAAMPEMQLVKGKYFRGDELPGSTHAELTPKPALSTQ
ncbi:MAG TPA: putative glycoside hydrolase [Terriglobales bacterium]|nr:putative glycoside hydrolase [Terriglobales bacterium]